MKLIKSNLIQSSPLYYLLTLNMYATGVYANMISNTNNNNNSNTDSKSNNNSNSNSNIEDDEIWDGTIRRVVIGVPANCSEKKKEATRRAARTAGFLEVLTIFVHFVQI